MLKMGGLKTQLNLNVHSVQFLLNMLLSLFFIFLGGGWILSRTMNKHESSLWSSAGSFIRWMKLVEIRWNPKAQ